MSRTVMLTLLLCFVSIVTLGAVQPACSAGADDSSGRAVYFYNTIVPPQDGYRLFAEPGGVRFEFDNRGKPHPSFRIGTYQFADGVERVTFTLECLEQSNTSLTVIMSKHPLGEYAHTIPASSIAVGSRKVTIGIDDFELSRRDEDFLMVPEKPDDVVGFGIVLSGSDAHASLIVKDFIVETRYGNHRVFDPDVTANPFTPSKVYAPVTKMFVNDGKPRIFLPGGSFQKKEWRDEILKMAEEWEGWIALDFSRTLWPSQRELVQDYNSQGIKTIYEGFKIGDYLAPYALNNRLYLCGSDGNTHPLLTPEHVGEVPLHNEDITTPEVIEFSKMVVGEAMDEGFSEFLLIDYIWPFFAGPWMGWGERTIGAFRNDLMGADRGLDLAGSDGKYRRCNFWEYLAHFTDVSFKPADLGFKSWEEFRPITPGEAASDPRKQKQLFLFVALYHYEYLKFVDIIGQFAEEKGGRLMVEINPEDISNGGDIYMMGRTRGIGKVAYEFFGSPFGTYGWYHNMRWYVQNLKKHDKDMALIGEIHPGGHGPNNYNFDAAYAFYYDIASSAKPIAYNNQYMDALWPAVPREDDYHFSRYGHWFAGASAFMLSHKERPSLQPAKEMVVVASRHVMELQDGFANCLTQVGNLGRLLDKAHYPFDSCGKEGFHEYAKDCRVLVYCPSQSSPLHLRDANNWIREGRGKTLLTHSYVPFTVFDGRMIFDRYAGGVLWEEGKSYSRYAGERQLRDAGFNMSLGTVHKNRQVSLTVNGRKITSTADVYMVQGMKTILASHEGLPLISMLKQGANNIIYIHADIAEKNDAFSLAVLDEAMKIAGIRKEAYAPVETAVHIYDVKNGKSCVLWDSESLRRQFSARGESCWRRENLDSPVRIEFPVVPNTRYLTYDFYGNKTKIMDSGSRGRISFDQSGTCEVFYYGKASDSEFKETVSSAQAAREKVFRFAPEVIEPVQPFDDARKGANPEARFLVLSAGMAPENEGKTDGVTINVRHHDRSAGNAKSLDDFRKIGEVSITGFSESKLMAIPLEGLKPGDLMIEIGYNGHTNWDNGMIYKLYIMRADGEVERDLMPDAADALFRKGVIRGKKLDSDADTLAKHGGVFGLNGGSIVFHPAWNQLTAPVYALFRLD